MVFQDLLLSLPVSGDVSQVLLSHRGQPRQQWMGWPCPSPPLQEGNLESEPALCDGVVLLPLMLQCPSFTLWLSRCFSSWPKSNCGS